MSYSSSLKESLKELRIKKDCCRRAFEAGLNGDEFVAGCPADGACYIRGTFVRCGSVTDPEKGYYLSLRPGRRSDEVKAILSAAGLDIGTTVRRGEELLYYRDSGKIEDFLAFVGQPKYALELMDKKITKNLRNNANRLANAETANYDRAATASAEQVAAIKLLIKNKEFNRLSPELAESARLRLEYPDLDLASLALMHSKKVSKSGLSHRMARLIEMAGKYM